MTPTYGPFVAPESPQWAPHEDGTRYGLDDQPTTCPHCGARTDTADQPDGSQRNTCLNPHCGFRFVGDWDDFNEDESENDMTTTTEHPTSGPRCIGPLEQFEQPTTEEGMPYGTTLVAGADLFVHHDTITHTVHATDNDWNHLAQLAALQPDTAPAVVAVALAAAVESARLMFPEHVTGQHASVPGWRIEYRESMADLRRR